MTEIAQNSVKRPIQSDRTPLEKEVFKIVKKMSEWDAVVSFSDSMSFGYIRSASTQEDAVLELVRVSVFYQGQDELEEVRKMFPLELHSILGRDCEEEVVDPILKNLNVMEFGIDQTGKDTYVNYLVWDSFQMEAIVNLLNYVISKTNDKRSYNDVQRLILPFQTDYQGNRLRDAWKATEKYAALSLLPSHGDDLWFKTLMEQFHYLLDGVLHD